MKLHGPFDFGLTGILASVLNPLRDAGVGIFALSTYDTDYVLVAQEQLDKAVAALRDAGHHVD
ncbi:ACT domain-containing protein [Deinococcus radiodurans]|nr:ACT domain-containing protein [Deinococcus radiodurans]